MSKHIKFGHSSPQCIIDISIMEERREREHHKRPAQLHIPQRTVARMSKYQPIHASHAKHPADNSVDLSGKPPGTSMHTHSLPAKQSLKPRPNLGLKPLPQTAKLSGRRTMNDVIVPSKKISARCSDNTPSATTPIVRRRPIASDIRPIKPQHAQLQVNNSPVSSQKRHPVEKLTRAARLLDKLSLDTDQKPMPAHKRKPEILNPRKLMKLLPQRWRKNGKN